MGAKHTIEDCHKLAKIRNLIFQSPVYINADTKHKWECITNGHKFEASYKNVLATQGCPKCYDINKRVTLEDCHKLAELRGFEFLSAESKITAIAKYKWRCKKDGFEWEARYNDIQQGRGCPKCCGHAKITLEDCHKLAELRGFEFLSTAFKTSHDKYKWRCKKDGFEWETTYSDIQQGKGCPKCSGHAKITLEECHKLANERNLEFLSTEFKISHDKYKWRCKKDGFEWQATHDAIKRGRGCPKCNVKHKAQDELTKTIEKIFNKKAETDSKPFSWLKYYKRMEIDIWLSELKFAAEYDGEGHFKPIKRRSKMSYEESRNKLRKTRRRDKKKNELIAAHPEEITYFVRFRYDEPIDDLIYVKNKLISAGVPEAYIKVV